MPSGLERRVPILSCPQLLCVAVRIRRSDCPGEFSYLLVIHLSRPLVLNPLMPPFPLLISWSQSYNTLLTLSHLADLSDGIILTSNEALHRLCNKLYNIPRPSFNVGDHITALFQGGGSLDIYVHPGTY